MSDKYQLPQHLDEPYKIFLWTLDEVFVFVIPVLLGLLLFNTPVIGVLIGITFAYAVKKLKGEEGAFYIHHLLYWYWPPFIPFRVIPPSYIRQWVG
jgi:conjugal transfer pilus assembly protein TraL